MPRTTSPTQRAHTLAETAVAHNQPYVPGTRAYQQERREVWDQAASAGLNDALVRDHPQGGCWVKSSSEPNVEHRTRVLMSGNELVVKCSCRAGQHGRICRHIFRHLAYKNLNALDYAQIVTARGHALEDVLDINRDGSVGFEGA